MVGKTQESGIPIGNVKQLVVGRAGIAFQKLRAVDEGRNPAATFECRHLRSSERVIETPGPRSSSVVRRKSNDRVFHQVVVLQRFEDVADVSVDAVHHAAEVSPDVVRDVRTGGQVLGGGDQRVVGCGEGQVQKQGSVGTKLGLKIESQQNI